MSLYENAIKMCSIKPDNGTELSGFIDQLVKAIG